MLNKHREIFLDVPRVTHLIEHKVELTEVGLVKHKPCPIPYKVEVVIYKEIYEILKVGVTEHSETPYTSPLVLVKKPDGTCSMSVDFKELNKITIFDPEPIMSLMTYLLGYQVLKYTTQDVRFW